MDVPGLVQVSTSGALCSQAALVRGRLSHSLSFNMGSSPYDIPSLVVKPQTASVA
jgi:hypothetical protein